MGSLHVSADVLFDLEHALNQVPFMGIPLGSTLDNIFNTNLYRGKRNWKPTTAWRDLVGIVSHFLRFNSRTGSRLTLSNYRKHQVVFTLLDAHDRYTKLILPVVAQMSTSEVLILIRDKSMADLLPSDIDYVVLKDLSFSYGSWLNQALRLLPRWIATLIRLLRQHDLPLFIVPHLLNALLISSKRTSAYIRLLNTIQPKAIITEYDRNYLSANLILAANARDIPTMTMQHGVINPPYGYVPVLAKTFFCWGKFSFEQLVNLGTDPSRLVITGCQRITDQLHVDRTAIRQELMVEDKTLVLYASNAADYKNARRQVSTFCEAFADQDDFAPVIRLHPIESFDYYTDEIARFSHVRFTTAAMFSQDEILAASDIVVIHNSGFGNDALVKRKLVIVLDASDAALGNGEALIAEAGCPRATSALALRHEIQHIVTDSDHRHNLEQTAKVFVRRQFSAFGLEATNNIVAQINERIALHD